MSAVARSFAAGRRGPRRVGVLVGLAAVLAVAGTSFSTYTILGGDRERQVSQAWDEYHDDLDRALWRMETRLAAILSRALSQTPQVAEVPRQQWIASPELEQGTEVFLDNWMVDVESGSNLVGAPTPQAVQEQLREGFQEYDPTEVVQQIADDNRGAPLNSKAGADSKLKGRSRSQVEYASRAQILLNSNTGPLSQAGSTLAEAPAPVPVWFTEDGRTRLFLGRATDTGVEVFQIDWSALEPVLLAEATDLFPEGRLEPVASMAVDPSTTQNLLAGIPARYVVDDPVVQVAVSGRTRSVLGALWALTALSLAGLLFGLRSALAFGEKHRRFTSAVTHELRTPLTTFQMYSEMLALGMVPEERRDEYLRTLESESRRLAGLVENALAYARLEEGRGPSGVEAVRVDALLERLEAPLRRSCEAGGGRLECLAPPEGAAIALDRVLRTDPDAVLQVLTNLVDNACKYGRGEGELVVRLEVKESPDGVLFTVADSGPGVPPAARGLVFRPFERAGRDESDAAPGVGLGLALAQDLARALGGDLVLDAHPGPGARFTLRLPV